MAKGLRSNRKKALRTLRRHDVAASSKFVQAEQRRLQSLHETAEAGKQARELRAQDAGSVPMDTNSAPAGNITMEAMDIDKPPAGRKPFGGIPVSQKKRMKIQKRKKADGINVLHKKKKKGKRKSKK